MSKKTKKCKYCKQEIDSRASICPYCQKKQGLSGAETLVATVVIIIIGAFGLKACAGIRQGYENAEKNASISSEADNFSETDYKAACKAVTYEELARDKEALKGEKVTFTGEVIQVADDIYRVNITKTEHGYSDTIIFEIDNNKLTENILEGDIVTVWGESKGFYSYESVLGQEITFPDVRAVYFQNSGKQQ